MHVCGPLATRILKTDYHRCGKVHTTGKVGFLDSEILGREEIEPLFTVIPVPLEQSVSYGGGTAGGPTAILAASQQLESWDGLSEPLGDGIGTAGPVNCRGKITTILKRIEKSVQAVVERRSLPVVLGGEHTVSLAPIRVLARNCPEPIGIIQIDAHADLRASFEGSPFSHACVMRRALEECGCTLLQFGVRALCLEEVQYRQEKRVQHLDGRNIPSQNLEKFILPGSFPQNIYHHRHRW